MTIWARSWLAAFAFAVALGAVAGGCGSDDPAGVVDDDGFGFDDGGDDFSARGTQSQRRA